MNEVELLLSGLIDEAREMTNSKMSRVDALTQKIGISMQGIFGKLASDYYDFKAIGWGTGYNPQSPANFNRAKEKAINFLEARLFQIKQFGVPVNFSRELDKLIATPEPKQSIYESGKAYDATQAYVELVRAAKQNIIVIDGYVDERTLGILSAKGDGVDAFLLTSKLKPEFKVLCETFNKQYRGLAVRTSSEFHDRFLVIDSTKWYIIGASIKDAGNKTFAMVQLTEKRAVAAMEESLKAAWSVATVII